MRYSVYHPKEKMLEKENLEQADDLSWMLRDRFLMLLVYYRLFTSMKISLYVGAL